KLRGHIEYKEKVNLKNCTTDLLPKNEKADQWQFDFNCLAALNTKLGLKLVTHIFADMNSPAGSHLSGTFRFAPQINIPSVKSAGEMLTEFSLNTEEWPE